MKLITKVNNYLRKNFRVGFMKNYPYRTSTEFVKKYFKNKEIICVEIGTFEGDNALNLLENVPNVKKMYLIDPWVDYNEYNEDKNNKRLLSKAEVKARNQLKKYSNKVVFIKKFSDDAITDVKEEIDFIYIDGNHDYEYVKKDIDNYFSILKKGGVIAGHDIWMKGVAKAFCEFVSRNKSIKDYWIAVMDWIIVKK